MRFTNRRYLVFIVLGLLLLFCPAGGRAQAKEAEWNILIYLCGSDLESQAGMATLNLMELSELAIPERLDPENVRVVIETGGCRRWRAKESLGLDISTKALQRYLYEPSQEKGVSSRFTLLEEIPLQSMGDEDTLADFIKWGTETYPAKHTVLYFWDHGGGSKTGLMIDELYDGDILYLYELKRALLKADVWLDLVIMDACLMANLETAQVLSHHASYFVSSEDLVPGMGGALEDLIYELNVNPTCGAAQLGRHFCDMTQVKYSTMENEQFSKLLTWSLIDLSKIQEVSDCFDEMFTQVGKYYMNMPNDLESVVMSLDMGRYFGITGDNMVDLGLAFYQKQYSDAFSSSLRNRMVKALNDAILYCVKGQGRSKSFGLSYCYAGALSEEECLDYIKNCQSIPYLVWLDALMDWDAPDVLYETVDRLPSLSVDSQFALQVVPCAYKDLPSLMLVDGVHLQLFGRKPMYEVFREGKDGKGYEKIGKDFAQIVTDEDGTRYVIPNLSPNWPAIQGNLIDMEVVNYDEENKIYNIPILMDEKVHYLRCFWRTWEDPSGEVMNDFDFLGIWEGYDEDSQMFNRNVRSMYQLQGREYRVLYPHYGEGSYSYSSPGTLERYMEIDSVPLEPGTYYVRYILNNLFCREYILPLIKTQWDGKHFSIDEKDMLVFEEMGE